MVFLENRYFFPSHLTCHLHLYLFCLAFLGPQQLWNGLNQVLYMDNVIIMSLIVLPQYPLKISTRHQILLLFQPLFVDLPVLLIGMVSPLLSPLSLLYYLSLFCLATNKPWNMSVGKIQCKQNSRHLRRITLRTLFLVSL